MYEGGQGKEPVFWYLNKYDNQPVQLHNVHLLEPRREKTGFLHMRKQRRRSASR